MRAGLSSHQLGLVIVTASTVAWSTTGLFTRILPLDAATMLVWRGVFGAAGLMLDRRRGLKGFAHLGWPGILNAVVSALGMVFFIASLRQTTVAHVAVI